MLGRIRSWALWSLPRRTLAVLLIVEAGTLGLVASLYRPISLDDVVIAGSAVMLSACYSWITLKWEGTRRILVAGASHHIAVDLLAIWCFFAAVLLPPQLSAIVVVLAELSSLPSRKLLNPFRYYRFVYSTSGIVLAACLTGLVMDLSLAWPARLLVATIVYLSCVVATLALALALTESRAALRVLLMPSSYAVDSITMGVALIEVALYQQHLSALLWLSVPVALVLQHRAVRVELQREAASTEKPMVGEAWQLVARAVVAASDAAAILRIDTGDPTAVAEVAKVQAGCDAIGENGPNGLAILLADCPGPNADAIATRLRTALRGNHIEANIAVAAKPRDGQSLADLLAVSEAELIAMEAATRSARSVRPEA